MGIAFRAKTLADPAVRTLLSRRFVLAMHNQVPDLYCNNSVDPGTDRYPREQVDRCPEGAGGGNLRVFFCSHCTFRITMLRKPIPSIRPN